MDDDGAPPPSEDHESFPNWEFPPAAPLGTPTAAEQAAGDVGVQALVLGSGAGPSGDTGDGARERPRWGMGRWVVVAVAGVFVLAGAGIGIKLFALRGTGDVLEQMVPGDADVYATAYLDPSLSQKLNLRTLVGKFPALKGKNGVDDRIDDLLAQAFQGSGLDFRKDVRPWLGTQLGLVVRIGEDQPHAALLVASKDDLAAQAALSKLRPVAAGTWTSSLHDGVEISIGHDPQGGPLVYAYVDHTAILSDDEDVVADVIDADRGTTPALSSKSDYAKALEGLPADRLVFVYVNSGRLLDRFVGELRAQSAFDPTLLGGESLSDVQAYRAVGATISAESSGIEMKISVSLDPSKMTAKARKALAAEPHRNVVLEWTPKGAFGLVAFTNAGDIVQQFVDQASAGDPEAKRSIDELGLTGAGGFVHHMTGDAGIVAGPARSGDQFPNVALLVGSDDRASAERFLGKLRDMISSQVASGGAEAQWRKETHGSVTITWLESQDLRSIGLEPSYAVADGMTIIGTSRDAVTGALDAHAGKGSIADVSTFHDALAGTEETSGLIEYFDVQGIASAVVDSLDDAARRQYEQDVAPNLRPVKAFSVTGEQRTDRSTIRLFVLIR